MSMENKKINNLWKKTLDFKETKIKFSGLDKIKIKDDLKKKVEKNLFNKDLFNKDLTPNFITPYYDSKLSNSTYKLKDITILNQYKINNNNVYQIKIDFISINKKDMNHYDLKHIIYVDANWEALKFKYKYDCCEIKDIRNMDNPIEINWKKYVLIDVHTKWSFYSNNLFVDYNIIMETWEFKLTESIIPINDNSKNKPINILLTNFIKINDKCIFKWINIDRYDISFSNFDDSKYYYTHNLNQFKELYIQISKDIQNKKIDPLDDILNEEKNFKLKIDNNCKITNIDSLGLYYALSNVRNIATNYLWIEKFVLNNKTWEPLVVNIRWKKFLLDEATIESLSKVTKDSFTNFNFTITSWLWEDNIKILLKEIRKKVWDEDFLIWRINNQALIFDKNLKYLFNVENIKKEIEKSEKEYSYL